MNKNDKIKEECKNEPSGSESGLKELLATLQITLDSLNKGMDQAKAMKQRSLEASLCRANIKLLETTARLEAHICDLERG
jgi:hypothetical protein